MLSFQELRTNTPLNDESVSPPRLLLEKNALCRHEALGSELLDYAFAAWWAWRDAADAMPSWSVFKPLDHPRILPNIVVFELIGLRFRCAIVGETVGDHLSVKMAHRFIDEGMPAQRASETTARLCRALGTGVPNLVERTMACAAGDEPTCYRALQLPFAASHGKHPRVLSVLDFRPQILLN